MPVTKAPASSLGPSSAQPTSSAPSPVGDTTLGTEARELGAKSNSAGTRPCDSGLAPAPLRTSESILALQQQDSMKLGLQRHLQPPLSLRGKKVRVLAPKGGAWPGHSPQCPGSSKTLCSQGSPPEKSDLATRGPESPPTPALDWAGFSH